MTTKIAGRIALLATLLLIVIALARVTVAVPTGATLTSNTTDTGPSYAADSLNTSRSTISTFLLNVTQQTQRWKAFVGNVTGSLTLDDSNFNTIYDWTGITVSGEVYATRNNSLTFTSVACASVANIATEHTALAMGTGADNITNTFDSRVHTPTIVAGTTLTNCSATTIYVNNVTQGNTESAFFQEFIMQDSTANKLVYVGIINNDKTGYNGETYDFQLIVPESSTGSSHRYYFYVELS